MARALVLGEDDLAVEDGLAFRRSGLAHLLAVSGMHLVLVVVGLVGVVRALLVRVPPVAARIDAARIASAAGIPAAWLYADFAGGSGSALRAAWMCSAVLAARVAARRPDTLRALSLSLGGMALLSPLALHDLSFVLSALATIGLLALAEPIELLLAAALARARLRPARADTERRVRSFVLRPVATTAAATVACAPVLATMAPELPLAGLVANLLAVPLGEAAALPLCLVHGLLEGWPAAEAGAAAAASGALALVRGVAHAFTWGGLPVPPPSPAQLAVLAAAAAGAALGDARRWVALGASALALAELAIRADAAPRGELRVTFLDVGQGDAALVDLPDGSAILVDGGGLVGSPVDVGERVVAPVLAARRRSSLAAVVLSHPHPDHHLGLPAAIARARPAAFWDTGQGEAEGAVGAYAGLLASVRGAGIPVLGPADLCGSRTIGGAIVDVLAPCPAHVPDRGPNDNSLVVRLRLDRRAILLVGDAEHVEEDELVARRGGAGLRADVLKVGHHGSRTSTTPSFLAAVAPRAAVISCGVRNRFGHPHVATLDTLGRAGVRVLRTDRDGGVVVRTDGRSLDVRAMAE
jgi:competence protein ComEC